ncbi:hypothetical protein OIU76_007769 [Salix suchowensis]|nr:hypothetical protein OIU76_007769 [Salix suchowensis]
MNRYKVRRCVNLLVYKRWKWRNRGEFEVLASQR